MAKRGARVTAAQVFFHVGVTGCRPFKDEALVMFFALDLLCPGAYGPRRNFAFLNRRPALDSSPSRLRQARVAY
ncbi:hypothetical protein A0O30_22150 [Pseudomonas sp. LLC-1]|nr:hypothetical protein A0O30_22150 [Pseudomonas sp. LLC-1]